MTKEVNTLFKSLLDLHGRFRSDFFCGTTTRLDELQKNLRALPASIEQTIVGSSAEGREIYQLRWGKGTFKVFMWTQMHGNEGTTTRSVMDLLHLLSSDHPSLQPIIEPIKNNISLTILPLLNPDGAERWQRENAFGIDLNRDARRFVAPESQLLRDLHQAIRPDLAFNLHDQSIYYTPGISLQPTTIALLAPPVDAQNSDRKNRLEAIRLIELFNQALQTEIPGQVARWSDDYEDRAFGEWSQRQGSPTILIEAGGSFNDPDREVPRALIFALLATALSIAPHLEDLPSLETYLTIPLNRSEGMFDSIERGVNLTLGDQEYRVDIGVREGEKTIGDLTDFGSYR